MGLGEQLRNARLGMNLTASQVAAGTRMKVQMVEQIESEDFHKVAAPIYGKGFIKLYAEYVGLDPKPLIDEYMFRFVDNVPRQSMQPSEMPSQPEVEEESIDLTVDDEPRITEETSLPPEIPEPAEEVVTSIKPPTLDKVDQTPVQEVSDADDFKEPDLFDETNISKQTKARSLIEEAGHEMNMLRSEDDEEQDQETVEDYPRVDDSEGILAAVSIKCSELIASIKEKFAGDDAEPSEESLGDSYERSLQSGILDLLNDPKVMISVAAAVLLFLIVVVVKLNKPSAAVPDGGGSGAQELELVEEPPEPYVD